MSRIHRRRSGLAMIMAIVLMALVGMALTAASVAMIAQARRTMMLGDDAQLRQLLLAGTTFALDHVRSSSDGQFSVALPDSLKRESAALTVKISSAGSDSEKDAEIEASLPRHRESQQIHLSLQAGTWRITQAALGE